MENKLTVVDLIELYINIQYLSSLGKAKIYSHPNDKIIDIKNRIKEEIDILIDEQYLCLTYYWNELCDENLKRLKGKWNIL